MKRFSALAICALSIQMAFAQAPEKMSYQSVIRDMNNELVTNQSVGMQISILQGSATGSSVYVETQSPTSNDNGLISLEIGSGTAQSGVFNSINWSNGPYFIQTEIDPTGGSNYTINGTSQLLSVPYALHAKTAETSLIDLVDDADSDPNNEIQVLSVNNDSLALSSGGGTIGFPNQVPSGSIMMWPASTPPAGWLICDGSSLDTAVYNNLYQVIGNQYGGSGNTFLLPNMEERVAVGASNQPQYSLGSQGGNETDTPTISVSGVVQDHTLTIAEMPSHSHGNGTYNRVLRVTGYNASDGFANSSGGTPDIYTSSQMISQGGDQPHNHGFLGTGSSSPVNVVQPYLSLHYIIKQ